MHADIFRDRTLNQRVVGSIPPWPMLLISKVKITSLEEPKIPLKTLCGALAGHSEKINDNKSQLQ